MNKQTMKTNYFLNKAGSPLGLLKALLEAVEGVKNNVPGGTGFVLRPEVFAGIRDGSPCGCVATASAQFLSGHLLTCDEISSSTQRRADVLGVQLADLIAHQDLVENLVASNLKAFKELWAYYGLKLPKILRERYFRNKFKIEYIEAEDEASLEDQLASCWKVIDQLECYEKILNSIKSFSEKDFCSDSKTTFYFDGDTGQILSFVGERQPQQATRGVGIPILTLRPGHAKTKSVIKALKTIAPDLMRIWDFYLGVKWNGEYYEGQWDLDRADMIYLRGLLPEVKYHKEARKRKSMEAEDKYREEFSLR